ncbi:MAG: VanZ family protein [Flavobacteriales bacterium]
MLKHLRWALLWALVILVLCLLPGKDLPEWHWFDLFDLDKLVHAGIFFVLALLLAQAFHAAQRPARWALAACGLTIAYGIGTEVLQGIAGMGRHMDVADMVADAIGGCVAVWYARRRVRVGKPVMPVRALR